MMRSSPERLNSSRKGVGCGRDAGFGTVVQKVKRGLSRQKVCILSAVDKDGNAFARAYNCGTPSQDNAMELACHLADDSSVTTDDTVAYERLLESNGCFHRVCQASTGMRHCSHSSGSSGS